MWCQAISAPNPFDGFVTKSTLFEGNSFLFNFQRMAQIVIKFVQQYGRIKKF